MFHWLLKLLGLLEETPQAAPQRPKSQPRQPSLPDQARDQEQPEADSWSARPLSPPDAAFLLGLLKSQPPRDLQQFAPHDRSFIAALMRKTSGGDLAIPILPEAAIRIRRLMANPDVHVSKFVEVFKNDPALSAEVLKVANSAYYGFDTPTHDLSQAVIRLGFLQVRALVMMMSMRSKVLHSGHYGAENELVATLALATARVCGALSKELGIGEEEAFTRGLLSHLEFFVILGVAAEFNSHHKNIVVTREAMKEASSRLGRDIFRLIGKKWGLENLGYGGQEEKEPREDEAVSEKALTIRDKIAEVALSLVEIWAGGAPTTPVSGIDQETLVQAVKSSLGLEKEAKK